MVQEYVNVDKDLDTCGELGTDEIAEIVSQFTAISAADNVEEDSCDK